MHAERSPVEHQFVVSPHHVGIESRHLQPARQLGQPALPIPRLAHVVGRGIHDGQHLCPCGHSSSTRLVEPAVFADQQAYAHALHLDHAGSRAGSEITQLIKHLVVGQFLLGIPGHALPFPQHGHGIVVLRHSHAARAQAVIATGVPHHHGEPLQIGQRTGDSLHGFVAGLLKRRPLPQILCRIAADGHFGREHQVRSIRMGMPCCPNDGLDIAGKITHPGIELGHMDTQSHEDRGEERKNTESSATADSVIAPAGLTCLRL